MLLCKNKIKKVAFLHKLVAEGFVCNVENKPEVNHRDGIKLYNFYYNLEWMTRSENIQHAYENGLKIGAKGIKNGRALLNKDDALCIKFSNLSGKILSKIYSISEAQISKIKNNKAWTHLR